MLEMSFDPGQTYYIAYRPWAGTWHQQLVQLQPAAAMCLNYELYLGKEWLRKK